MLRQMNFAFRPIAGLTPVYCLRLTLIADKYTMALIPYDRLAMVPLNSERR